MPYRRSVRWEGKRKKGGGERKRYGDTKCSRKEIPERVFSTVEPGEKNPDVCLTAMRERETERERERERERDKRKGTAGEERTRKEKEKPLKRSEDSIFPGTFTAV